MTDPPAFHHRRNRHEPLAATNNPGENTRHSNEPTTTTTSTTIRQHAENGFGILNGNLPRRHTIDTTPTRPLAKTRTQRGHPIHRTLRLHLDITVTQIAYPTGQPQIMRHGHREIPETNTLHQTGNNGMNANNPRRHHTYPQHHKRHARSRQPTNGRSKEPNTKPIIDGHRQTPSETTPKPKSNKCSTCDARANKPKPRSQTPRRHTPTTAPRTRRETADEQHARTGEHQKPTERTIHGAETRRRSRLVRRPSKHIRTYVLVLEDCGAGLRRKRGSRLHRML